ncbi:MAG: S8 family serine peptidase [Endomicrobium sp.]|jgi:subtilisin family serine protease|nr:S8 family serine peptidase [Endomicrobium sp.]
MKNISFRIVIVLSILSGFLSYASGIVITERLKNASVKEQRATTSAFSSKDEVPVYLRGISGQGQSVETPDYSRLSDKIEVIFYPVDGKSDNVDTSFFTMHNIEYVKSESYLIAYIPVELIPELEKISGAYYADISDHAKPMETVSEGRDAINATKFVLDGVDGAGVKIAVLDKGFKGYLDLQNRGELPRNLTTVDFTNSQQPVNPSVGDTHGSACAEIIYDIAPAAEMYLLKVDNQVNFQNALAYCSLNSIKIVSCSIGFDVPESFMAGGGRIDTDIDTNFTSNKFLSVVAAGNEADHTWFGSFQNSGTSYTRFPNGSEFLNVNVPTDADITLMWDDYNGNSIYNIYVYDQYNNEIGHTNFIQNHIKKVTFSNYTRPNRLKIRIFQYQDTLPNGRDMRLVFSKGNLSGDVVENPIDINPESSLCMPADARGALTVGAVNVSNYGSGPIAYYSSRGPVRNPWLMKPELVAPTGVTTASLGYKSFAGTSAAAPHVAGAAALLLSLSTGTAVSDLKDQVVGYARQIQSSPDCTYGNGKLVLDTSLVPPNSVGDFVCYPNPVSISQKGYIKITNLPFHTDVIDINVYTVTGEFVKSFNASDLIEEIYTAEKRRMVKWDLRNQDGNRIAPGVYFVVVKTLLGDKKVKKIGIQK